MKKKTLGLFLCDWEEQLASFSRRITELQFSFQPCRNKSKKSQAHSSSGSHDEIPVNFCSTQPLKGTVPLTSLKVRTEKPSTWFSVAGLWAVGLWSRGRD
uniref:Uncharacterized protein n=1 Tax=Anguilla anguilla TaxID=7936 RepID=A0A0E9R4Z0_ANGAN